MGGADAMGAGGAARTGTGGGAGVAGASGSVDAASDDAVWDAAAGVTDAAPDGGARLEPIRVTPGTRDAGSTMYADVRFVGVGLDQYEGLVVTFRIGSETGTWPLGSGQVRIVNGAFDVLFHEVLPPTYQLKVAHIDLDGNGRCEAGDEPAFGDQSLSSTDVTLTVTPTDLRFRPAPPSWCEAVNSWPMLP
jgi:hypothetical protein